MVTYASNLINFDYSIFNDKHQSPNNKFTFENKLTLQSMQEKWAAQSTGRKRTEASKQQYQRQLTWHDHIIRHYNSYWKTIDSN
ncbi:hypothetical protein DM01DRAFT_1370818 [Hesseltinella vesiculosa]|uniref:Uncharacterized protein n=1 Tax=Hesseltinella vesiculosa TaxID=101127 RepID=A0A1X2GUV2_9FUNG|nr:hypothetical protein DM01DRAFT_1370818 [Hesseltinella vesiculosa]